MALGNILRGRKEFDECAEVYGKGIATIANPERPHWLIYYFRGICNERAKKWSAAEADLKKALKLYPDQPHVLNYLGYSWIDQGVNLDEGMRMIRRAVEQRPDDGYIVDSLGWAYYRLGNYEEAVKHLERAVELKPDDPTINDHLGDGYWKTGRMLEAQFQWSHAHDLKPEPEELEKIEQKLKSGPDRGNLVGGRRQARSPATAADARLDKPCHGGQVSGHVADMPLAPPPRSSNTHPPRSISRCACSAAAPTAITRSKAWWCSRGIGDRLTLVPGGRCRSRCAAPHAAAAGAARRQSGAARPRARSPRRSPGSSSAASR